jgi:hypothetical protein
MITFKKIVHQILQSASEMKNERRKLADIFPSSEPAEQGPGESVLTSSDNILGFKRKLIFWKNDVVKGNPETFPLLLLRPESEGRYQEV